LPPGVVPELLDSQADVDHLDERHGLAALKGVVLSQLERVLLDEVGEPVQRSFASKRRHQAPRADKGPVRSLNCSVHLLRRACGHLGDLSAGGRVQRRNPGAVVAFGRGRCRRPVEEVLSLRQKAGDG
jgi:hypothetical protein